MQNKQAKHCQKSDAATFVSFVTNFVYFLCLFRPNCFSKDRRRRCDQSRSGCVGEKWGDQRHFCEAHKSSLLSQHVPLQISQVELQVIRESTELTACVIWTQHDLRSHLDFVEKHVTTFDTGASDPIQELRCEPACVTAVPFSEGICS